MNSNADRARNLERAGELVAEAAAEGAELVVLPEKWPLLGSAEVLREGAEPLDGPAMTAAAGWAAERGIWLLAGSFAERPDAEGSERLFNTSPLFGPDGRLLAVYRKLHLFDVEVDGVVYRESESEAPGEEIVVSEVAGVPLGMSICFDLRFPELYRILALRGARILAVPSAFTEATGRDHWEVLLRARAIENACFVVAADQVGEAPPQFRSFGGSLVCDAWGQVLCRVERGEGVAVAELDFDEQLAIRERMPCLDARRPDVYEWPESGHLTGSTA